MEHSFYAYLKDQALVRPDHLSQLMSRVTIKKYPKGAFLLRREQVCRYFFYIEKGLTRFFSVDAEGKEHIVQFAPESWFVSDRSSIYFNRPSLFFIDAIEDTEAVMLDQPFMEFAASVSPEFRNYNEYILQNHIRQMQNRINSLLGATAQERYQDFVRMYPDLLQRAPLWMIASYLGMTPESLSRVRKELSRQHGRPE